LLLECLSLRARQSPLILILEDCHWIDPLSADLLEFIARNLSGLPVLIVALYRPSEGQPEGDFRFTTAANFTEIRLVEFTALEAEDLIRLKVSQQFGIDEEIPDLLFDQIQRRAQGNPFYIDEIINFLHDRKIDPMDVASVEGLELPESLHSLIISRIDQL